MSVAPGIDLRRALRLYLIADAGIVAPSMLPEIVARAIDGGVTMVQLRAKSLSTRAQVDLARRLGERCRAAGVPLLVNDRADVAAVSGAIGVHVGHIGEEDLSPLEVRRVLGPAAVVGVSVGGPAEASRVEDADYLSAGPMFATSTKADAGPAAGAALVRAVRSAVSGPLVAIGGIRAEHVRELVAAGADGVCVASAILRSSEPRDAATEIARALSAAMAEVPA